MPLLSAGHVSNELKRVGRRFETRNGNPKQESIAQIPDTGLGRIAGQDRAIEQYLNALTVPHQTSNVLLLGPPGTAKSSLVRACRTAMNLSLETRVSDERIHPRVLIRNRVRAAAQNLARTKLREIVLLYNFTDPSSYDFEKDDPVILFEGKGHAREFANDLRMVRDSLFHRMIEREAPEDPYILYRAQCLSELNTRVSTRWNAGSAYLRFKLTERDGGFDFVKDSAWKRNSVIEQQSPKQFSAAAARFRKEIFEPAVENYHKRATRESFASRRRKQWHRTLELLRKEEAPLREKLGLPHRSLDYYATTSSAFDYFPHSSSNIIVLHVNSLREKWGHHPRIMRWLGEAESFLQEPDKIDLMEEPTDSPQVNRLKKMLTANTLIDTRHKTSPIAQSELGAITPENFLGSIAHDAYDREPEHLRIRAGAASSNHIVYIDEPAGMLQDPELRARILTYLQSGVCEIGGPYASTSSHVHARIPGLARLVLNTNKPLFPDGSPMARRFKTVALDSMLDSSPDIVQHTARVIGHEAEKIGKSVDPAAAMLLLRLLSAQTSHSEFINGSLAFPQNLVLQIACLTRGNTVTRAMVQRQFEESRLAMLAGDRAVYLSFAKQHEDDSFGPRIGTLFGVEVTSSPAASWPLRGYGLPVRVEAELGSRSGLRERIRRGVRGTNLPGDDSIAGTNHAYDLVDFVLGPFNKDILLSWDGVFKEHSGPSGSAVETYVMFSRLLEIPVLQNTFVTGTMRNLHGDIGGIECIMEKLEGCYDAWHELMTRRREEMPLRFLYPAVNNEELMLALPRRPDVVRAISDGRIELGTHQTYNEGLALCADISEDEVKRRVRTYNARQTKDGQTDGRQAIITEVKR